MPSWVTIACGILKAFGLIEQAERLFKSYQDKAAGRREQLLADLQAKCDEMERQAQAIANAPTTQEEIVARLREGGF